MPGCTSGRDWPVPCDRVLYPAADMLGPGRPDTTAAHDRRGRHHRVPRRRGAAVHLPHRDAVRPDGRATGGTGRAVAGRDRDRRRARVPRVPPALAGLEALDGRLPGRGLRGRHRRLPGGRVFQPSGWQVGGAVRTRLRAGVGALGSERPAARTRACRHVGHHVLLGGLHPRDRRAEHGRPVAAGHADARAHPAEPAARLAPDPARLRMERMPEGRHDRTALAAVRERLPGRRRGNHR